MSSGAIAGASIALRLETTTSGTYVDIGGLRTKSFTINNEPIDTTNSDSTGRWREYLTGGLSVKSISFSGDGVLKDGAPLDRLITVVMSASGEGKCQLFLPTIGTFEGMFKLTNTEFGGEHGAEGTFSTSGESNGVITFTTIT